MVKMRVNLKVLRHQNGPVIGQRLAHFGGLHATIPTPYIVDRTTDKNSPPYSELCESKKVFLAESRGFYFRTLRPPRNHNIWDQPHTMPSPAPLKRPLLIPH